MSETRKDKRAPVSLKVRFKSATLDEFIEQYSKDISRGGIFIKTKKPMAIGTLLKFEFQLQDQSRLIHGVGRVVWVQEPETASEVNPAGMGIKFVKMDPESRSFVERVVDQRGDVAGAFDHHANASEPPSAPAESFFPSDAPTAELPPPEDRTVVRHASEFLESALADADEAAAAEARAEAEAARNRARELERRRLQKQSNEALSREALGAADTMLASPLETAPPREEARAPNREEPVEAAPAALATAPRKVHVEDEEAWEKPAETRASRPGARPSSPEPQAVGLRVQEPEVVATRPVKKKSPAIPVAIAVVALVAVGVVLANRSEAPSPVAETPQVAPVQTAPPPAEPSVEEPVEATDEAEALALAAGEPTAEAEPAREMAKVEIKTAPAGAEVFVGGESKGKSPLTIELPVGEEVTIRAKATGRAEGQKTVVVEAQGKPVELALAELEYFIEIDSVPNAVRVQGGGGSLTTPGRLKVRKPSDSTSVVANKTGYEQLIERVALSSFEERDGAMVAKLSLAMKPVAAPAKTKAPEKADAPPKDDAAPEAPAEPKEKSEPTEAAKPAEPKPAEPSSVPTPVAPTPPTPPAAPVVPAPEAP